MGAGASAGQPVEFKTKEEALEAGKTEQEIEAYLTAKEMAPKDDAEAAEQDSAAKVLQGKQRQKEARAKVEAKKAEMAEAEKAAKEAEAAQTALEMAPKDEDEKKAQDGAATLLQGKQRQKDARAKVEAKKKELEDAEKALNEAAELAAKIAEEMAPANEAEAQAQHDAAAKLQGTKRMKDATKTVEAKRVEVAEAAKA